tara:strand:- start:38 stop:1039 length:1002 start_codon:yes stop_codon:yes gene_type:complete
LQALQKLEITNDEITEIKKSYHKKEFSENQEEEIIKLYEKDEKSMKKIGEIFNCSRGTVSRILKENGIKIRIPNNLYKNPKVKWEHIYRPNFQLICYQCKNPFIWEGQKNGTLRSPVCQIRYSYKEKVFCSKKCWKQQPEQLKKKRDWMNKKYSKDEEYRKEKLSYQAQYREENLDKIKNYEKNNRDKINARARDYLPKRRARDLDFRLRERCRIMVYKALTRKGVMRSMRTKELIGCDNKFLKKHLESLFTENMSWENWSQYGWHIDHIRPCESFNFESIEQRKVAFNWRNLQPLSASENTSKQHRYLEEDEKLWIKRMKDLGFEGELFLKY